MYSSQISSHSKLECSWAITLSILALSSVFQMFRWFAITLRLCCRFISSICLLCFVCLGRIPVMTFGPVCRSSQAPQNKDMTLHSTINQILFISMSRQQRSFSILPTKDPSFHALRLCIHAPNFKSSQHQCASAPHSPLPSFLSSPTFSMTASTLSMTALAASMCPATLASTELW